MPAGYYDAETPEKCTKVSELHTQFYEDLKIRHEKAREAFQTYHGKLQELISQQQQKVAHHSSKMNIGWTSVSKT